MVFPLISSGFSGDRGLGWAVVVMDLVRSVVGGRLRRRSQELFDLLLDLFDLERQPLDLVETHRVDEVDPAKEEEKLAVVHLGDEHLVEARQDRSEVAGQWAEIAEVDERHASSSTPNA